MPRFSVVVPAANRSRALLPTLASVAAQTEGDFELLVVSDGSTDDTDAVARSFAVHEPRCRVLRVPRFGHPSGPRNAGVAAARGRFVAYLDHDDTWHPDHLAVLGELLDGAPWAATGAERVDAAGVVRDQTTALDLVWSPELQLAGPLFEPSRVGHHRELLAASGGWREDAAGLEDWDLWTRWADAGLRPALSARRTARLELAPTTRRHAMGWRWVHPLATVADPRAAEAALARLREPDVARATLAAARLDLRDSYADPAGLVLPREGAGDLPALLDAALDAAPAPWADVAVGEVRGRPALVRTLACARPEHAARLVRLVRRTQRRQLAVVQRVAREAAAAPV